MEGPTRSELRDESLWQDLASNVPASAAIALKSHLGLLGRFCIVRPRWGGRADLQLLRRSCDANIMESLRQRADGFIAGWDASRSENRFLAAS